MHSSISRLLKLLVPAGILLVGLTLYLSWSAKEGYEYYMTVSEFRKRIGENAMRPHYFIRIAGTVTPGSIEKRLSESESVVEFEIEEGGERLEVLYNGIAPDTFKDEISVVVEGPYRNFENNRFRAEQLVTKCASKYVEGESPLGSSYRNRPQP